MREEVISVSLPGSTTNPSPVSADNLIMEITPIGIILTKVDFPPRRPMLDVRFALDRSLNRVTRQKKDK